MRLALVRSSGEPVDASLVIFRELLGDVVMPVDQRRFLEDSVDPGLNTGSIGWAVTIVGMSVSAAAASSMVLKVMGRGLGTALRGRNRKGKEAGDGRP
jgi:hypothetical protein